MRLIETSRQRAQPIELFESVSASSVSLGNGSGEAHVYCVYFGPGGRIGEHQAGCGQLLLVIDGQGWAAGANGERAKLSCGQEHTSSPESFIQKEARAA